MLRGVEGGKTTSDTENSVNMSPSVVNSTARVQLSVVICTRDIPQ
jgi:hypothetical protein